MDRGLCLPGSPQVSLALFHLCFFSQVERGHPAVEKPLVSLCPQGPHSMWQLGLALESRRSSSMAVGWEV